MVFPLGAVVLDILELILRNPELVLFVIVMGAPWMAGFYLLYLITKRVLKEEGAEGLATLDVEKQLINLSADALKHVTQANQEVVAAAQALVENMHQHELRAQTRFEMQKGILETATIQMRDTSHSHDRQLSELVLTVRQLVDLEVDRMTRIEELLGDIKQANIDAYEELRASLVEKIAACYEQFEKNHNNGIRVVDAEKEEIL